MAETIVQTFNVTEPLPAYYLVATDKSGAGRLRLASSTDIDRQAIGLVTTSYPTGSQQVTIVTEGVVNNPLWNWTVGPNTGELYLGPSGELTQDALVAINPLQRVATILAPTSIYVQVDTVDKRGAIGPAGPTGPTGSGGGVTGPTGPSVTGPTGASGYSGIDGAAGASGYSGYSGIDGASGFSGYSGAAGASGFSGYSGIDGAAGASGFSGYSGIDGAAGASGYSGIDGTSGFSGYSGVAGASGFSGYSGTTGAVSPLAANLDANNFSINNVANIVGTATGSFNVDAGTSGGGGGNAIYLRGGAPTTGDGGSIQIQGRNAGGTNQNGGFVSIVAGNKTGLGVPGEIQMYVEGGQALTVTGAGNVSIGLNSDPIAANNGFPYIPATTSTGAPSGVPTAIAGYAPMIAQNDGGTYKLWLYIGGGWRSVTLT